MTNRPVNNKTWQVFLFYSQFFRIFQTHISNFPLYLDLMPTVNFTQALKRFYPGLKPMEVSGSTVAEIVEGINASFPGIKDYLVDEQGRLRQHVNIFVGEKLIRDKTGLTDTVELKDEVYIMQALSGG